MNGEPPGKAVAAGEFGVAAQRVGIAEIDMDGLDRRHFRRRRAEQAERAGDPIGFGERAVGFAVGFRAEFGRQVLGSPGHADEPRAAILVGAGGEQAHGRFDRLRQDLDRAFRQAGDGFARGQLGVEMGDGRAALGLGEQDGVGRSGNDRVEIGVGHAGVEPVDAHQQAGAVFLRSARL